MIVPVNRKEPVVVREYEKLKGLSKDEIQDLEEFALENQTDRRDKSRPAVLVLRNNQLYAQNYVGVIETRKRTVLEILPKVDFFEDKENNRRVFLNMLRAWRGFKWAQLPESGIMAMQRFNMLEVFVWLFLNNLVLLAQRGLARHYQPVEDNLSCLRGRILFPQHIRENSTNQARFYVGYDEFTTDRPANRLIHSAIQKLIGFAREPKNQQLLHQLRICFADVPESTRLENDWQRHRVDRSMQHYDAVMQWVRLFLFNHGLTTFAGKHVNQSLLFPMEEVFESFVASCFRRYQEDFSVYVQQAKKYLAEINGQKAFALKPDIRLERGKETIILDTKWKRINENGNDRKHDISQADMYQLFAYGKKHGCKQVALVYPKTKKFQGTLRYKFDDKLSLFCFPFDVTEPKASVEKIIGELNAPPAGGG